MHQGEEGKFLLAAIREAPLFTVHPAVLCEPCGSVGAEERRIRQMGEKVGRDTRGTQSGDSSDRLAAALLQQTQSLWDQLALWVWA